MRTRFAHIMSWLKTESVRLLPTSKKYWVLSVCLFALLVGVSFVFGSEAHAQFDSAELAKSIGTWIMTNVIIKPMLMLAKICISLTVFALEFFVKLAKYNGYIDTPIVIVGWTMVRDVANMFFVVVLLVIAFGTILGLEQYEWKKTMVNFILAAILINFSKLIAGVIIDVAHVFTMTFVNAIAATAGGNLINMFHLNKIVSITAGGGTDITSDILIEVFGGAVMALVFSVLALFTMGAYMIIMIARVVVLWALIILSPLAYILGVIPQTKSYADTWWSEFGRHVAVAPVMVFFLWLAFATLGSGNFVAGDLGITFAGEEEAAKALGISTAAVQNPGVSISEVSSWENMANFILAIAFLWIGIEQVQKMGTRGSEFLNDAKNFAVKTAVIGSGYALGRWLVGEAGDKGKSLAGKAAYRAPLVGGRAWVNRGYKVGEWWGENVTQKRNDIAKNLDSSYRDLQKKKLKHKYEGPGEVGYLDMDKNDTGFFSNVGAHFGRFAASMVETQGRKDKVAEDVKETYERRQKIIDESYSTSGLAAGIRKQEVTGELKFVEQLSENKKPQKMAEIMSLILRNQDAFEYYARPAMTAGEKRTLSEEQRDIEEKKRLQEIREGDDGQKTMDRTAAAQAEKELLDVVMRGVQDLKLNEANTALLGNGDNELVKAFMALQLQKETAQAKKEHAQKSSEKDFKGTAGGKVLVAGMNEQKALLENLNQEMSRATEAQLAIARAAEYRDKGKILKAGQIVQSVYERHEKEDSAEINAMNRDQRKDAGAQLLNLLHDPNSTDEQKQQAQRDLVRLVTVSANKGYDDFQSISDELISHIYAREGKDAADFKDEDSGKHLLEMFTGKIIDGVSYTFSQAQKDFRKMFPDGDEGTMQQQAVLASAKNALWTQGESGGFKLAPAITAKTDSEGKKTFEISNPDNDDDKSDRRGSREELGKHYVRMREVTNLQGLAETKRKAKKDTTGKITGYDVLIEDLTNDQMENLMASHTQFSDTREASSGFHQNFSSANASGNFSKTAKKKMAKFFKDLRDDYGGRGMMDVYTRIIQTQYADLYKQVSADKKVREDANITEALETLDELTDKYGSAPSKGRGGTPRAGGGTPPAGGTPTT